jgi:hypothetical protein
MTRGHRLRPWRSPYLRWRIETYSGIPAESIGFNRFWTVVWKGRREFVRYLRWADRMRNFAVMPPSRDRRTENQHAGRSVRIRK